MIITVDTGAKLAGVACWEDGELACAFLARGKDWEDTALNTYLMLLERFPRSILEELAVDKDRFLDRRARGASCVELILERPQIYQQRFLKGDPNDLVLLAYMGGALAGYLNTGPILYYPKEWKRQVPKKIMVERVKSKLSKEEHARVELPRAKSLHHNIWDGVGIGLYRLGRIGRR